MHDGTCVKGLFKLKDKTGAWHPELATIFDREYIGEDPIIASIDRLLATLIMRISPWDSHRADRTVVTKQRKQTESDKSDRFSAMFGP